MSQGNGRDEEARMFVAEDAAEDVLSELEHRYALERAVRVAAGVTIDIQDRGPLSLYVQQRRQEAVQSLLDLACNIDAKDAVAIAKAQTNVVEYMKVCDWTHSQIVAGQQADDIIKEHYAEHGNDPEHPDPQD